VSKLQPILEKLSRARAELLQAADAIASPQWLEQTKAGCWSAGGVVGHLSDVERAVRGYADRIIRKTALPVPFYKRLHFPLALVESRKMKRKVPAIVTPSTELADKETMLRELRSVRERTLAFLEETRHRELIAYSWRHPFLGRLNFYDWFRFLAAHEIRHSKQMWEIGQNLRKGVASSRK
jgi:DinB superfamily